MGGVSESRASVLYMLIGQLKRHIDGQFIDI